MQKAIPVYFEEVKTEVGFSANLIVENRVLRELKSVEIISPVYYIKLLTRSKLSILTNG